MARKLLDEYHRTASDEWPKRKHKPKETTEDLSPSMREALTACFEQGVHPDDFGTGEKARWSHATRAALVRHGLIQKTKNRKGRELWRPTDRGRGLMMAYVPRFLMPLHRRAIRYETLPPAPGKKAGRVVIDDTEYSPNRDLGYTHRPHEALRGEPEAA